MTIGQRIMQIRVSCGLSQEEFGKKLDTSRQSVSKWELDITVPEVEKIVKISRLFSVSTDSILVDGISTFDDNYEQFVCGIYKSETVEIVETERISLLYYSNVDRTVFGAKAYVGFDDKKALRAVCEYNTDNNQTKYAYITDNEGIFSNDVAMEKTLGEAYDINAKKRLLRSEKFYVSREKLPSVEEVGLKNCLMQWRMSTTFKATASRFSIFICTDKTEYTFDIAPQDNNIYCAISNSKATDLGLFTGKQFFRIRNYRDNEDAFCSSFCELGFIPKDIVIPTVECVSGACVNTSAGLFFGVKRYNNDEIILCGCGGDEYRYSRTDEKLERFTLVDRPNDI